ncbi:M23 family metallopeptidase [Thalassobacillus sp. B23F22_16]|uniref:M23 family metallopeptidase n=1 Tax=Thalassobacillus sp. B23F22_16 TaxID=3459513 RepID=UPI00373F57D3
MAAGLLLFTAACTQADHSMEASALKQEDITKKKDRIGAEEFGEAFLGGQYTEIYGQTSEQFQEQVSYNEFKQLAEQFNHNVSGYELEASSPVAKHQERYVWLDDQGEKGIQVVYDKHSTIQGLFLAPLQSFPETDEVYTANTYTMPIKEEWMVFWGGTNQLLNYHYPTETQRYAYDLLMTKNGSSYHGNPEKNKHYYAFGKEVAAPADGVVVKAIDGIEDNVPGEMNSGSPLGNHVVLEHKNGEYSLLAHLKKNSILVEAGDEMTEGDVLGLTGNSGNSSEPHIHFQVMDNLDFFEAKSIRIQFENREEPIQGDTVTP